MARLAIAKDFFHDLRRLEPGLLAKVSETFAKFQNATHAGVHLEKIRNARDDRLRSIRVDQFWRGIVLAPERGDIYTLLKVLPHDEAYRWAERHQVSVNAATGGIEIRDVVAIGETLPGLVTHAERVPTRLFDHVSDSDMRGLGIDEQVLEFARALTDVVQLEAAKSFLPQAQWEALYGLAAGMTPEEVWKEVGASAAAERYDTEDVEAALERSRERVVLVDGPDELMEIFRRPFDLWRIYLHPVQYQAVHARYRGPARVTGGPGTGKTVVAVHRAWQLAKRGEGPVLLTTFTSNLAASLEASLNLLADSDEVRDRITVTHVDQLAHKVFRTRHGHPTLLNEEEQRLLWRRVISRLELPFKEGFLAEEWRQVVLAQGITHADGYLAATRQGRGRRLGSRQRAQVWQAIHAFQEELHRQRAWTHETVCVEATRLLREMDTPPYRHIVVDEAQDLSPMQWRLLRAAVPRADDDLFIAGDPHQRIYNNRVSLRDVGVNVTGRSSRLTVNYRTTAEILAWSLAMLRGERIDDMDGGLETVAGYRSEVHGSPPVSKGFPTKNDELRALAERVSEWLDAGVRPAEIGIAARSNMLVDDVVAALTKRSIPARSMRRAGQDDDAVAVGTMHRMKGLEFRCMGVVGVTAYQIPAPNAVTPADEDRSAHEQDLLRERCLLFVACTRAREQLYVSWHGTPSPFLPSRRD
jgi:hypothetical protein